MRGSIPQQTVEGETSVPPLPTFRETKKHRLHPLQTLPSDLVTMGEVADFEQTAKQRGMFKHISEQNWYERDREYYTKVHYRYSNGAESLEQPFGRMRPILYRKAEEGHYLVNMPLNNRSMGVEMKVICDLPTDEWIELYTRTNLEASNREGYRVVVLNRGTMLQLRISIYRKERFKLWRQLEVPTEESGASIQIKDSGNKVQVAINEFTLEMPPMIPIFTDFYLHLQRSVWAELKVLEVSYFERQQLAGGLCSCNKRCSIF